MSPVIFGCIVCGHAVYGYETSAEGSWLKEFRASRVFQAYDKDPKLILSVYSSPEGIFISGVGRYNDPDGGTTRIVSSKLATSFRSCGSVQKTIGTDSCFTMPAGVFSRRL